MSSRAAVVVGATLLLLFSVGPSAAGHASPTDRAVPLEGCGTITDPGTYELAANVTAEDRETCLRVQASDVVLDGAGHTIRGDGSTQFGVLVRNASNVTVRNLRTSRVVHGVTLQNVTDGRVTGVTAVASARSGIWLVDSRRIVVEGTTVERTGFFGIRLDDTADSRVVDSTARHGRAGISLGRTRGNRVEGNDLAENGIGIELAGAVGNDLVENTVVDNDFGIVLAVSTDNVVANNSVRRNGDGIRLDEAGGNVVRSNRLSDNRFGLYLAGSSGNTLRSNAIDGGRVGIELTLSSDDNTVTRNAVRVSLAGIRVTASAGNTVAENAVAVVGDTTATAGADTATTIGATAGADAPASETDADQLTVTGPGFGVLGAVLALLVAGAGVVAWSRSGR